MSIFPKSNISFLILALLAILFFCSPARAEEIPSIPLPTPSDSPSTELDVSNGQLPIPAPENIGQLNPATGLGPFAPLPLESSVTDLTAKSQFPWTRLAIDIGAGVGGALVIIFFVERRAKKKAKIAGHL